MKNNDSLNKAKKEKKDEFYTQLPDIEKEVEHYKDYFKGKVVYCNCDSPSSNFIAYFKANKELLEITEVLVSSVDFRSTASREILEKADIIVTNPPFSLFREYIDQLMCYNKDFLIIGNINAITYSNLYQHLISGKVSLGYTTPKVFEIPFYYPLVGNAYALNGKQYATLGNACWYTTLKVNRADKVIPEIPYNPEYHLKYIGELDAINVPKTKHIPVNYKGIMGVPITYLFHHNDDLFEIIGVGMYPTDYGKPSELLENETQTYKRIWIKYKN